MDRKLVWIFLFWLSTLLFVGFFSLSLPSFSSESGRYVQDPPFHRWDSNWYISIADSGYSFTPGKNSNIAFFPLYPSLIRLGHEITTLRLSWVGFYLSIIFSLSAFFMFYRLLLLDYCKSLSKKIILTWLFFPFSYFLISVYSESLFIFLTIASIYFARKKKWLAAALLASLAVLTRPYGIFLLPILLWEYLTEQKDLNRSMRQGDFWILALLPTTALIGFIIFNKVTLGEPFAFLLTQQTWGRIFSSPLPVFWAYAHEIFKTTTYSVQNMHFIVDFVALLFIIFAIFLAHKKSMRKPYILLSIFFVAPPLFNGTFTSLHRYVLAAFPLFIIPAVLFEKNKWLLYGYCFVSFLLLLFFTSLFSRWSPLF